MKGEWTIYHNPKCSKSRQALDLLRMNNVDPQIIEYMETPPNKRKLEEILGYLKVEPKEILRTKEGVFSELNLDLNDSNQVLQAIVDHPELLERPIICCGDKAVIGRPPEKVLELLR